MRRLLLVTTGLLLTGVIALGLALRSESFALGAARWAVATFTDLRLEMRNPRLDVYQGSLSADEIHLMPTADVGPPLLSVLDISAYVPPRAFFGVRPITSFLRVGSVQIYVSEGDKTADPKPMQWLGYLRLLPTELRIGQVHLVNASANTWIFPLKQVRGDKLEPGNYRLTADADYEGEPLGITLDLLTINKGWGKTAAGMSIKLQAPESGSEFILGGELEGTAEDFKYKFDLNAYYRDIREFLKGFEGGGDLAGELRLQGIMIGDAKGFVLSDATFLLINLPDYAFQSSGTLAYDWSGKSTIELLANGEIASLAYLVNWEDLDVGDFGRARSSIRLSGSLDKPVIDEFKLTTSTEAGLTVSVSGQLNLFDADAGSGPGNNAISLDMQGPTLAALEHWLGELPFETGPWRASGQLTGDQANLALQNIVLETGAPGALELRATGAVGRITQPQGPQEKYTVGDIRLLVKALAPDSAELGTLLGRTDIPPGHELEAELTVQGTGEELQLGDGRFRINSDELQASAGALSAVLRPAASPPLSDLSGDVLIELGDSAALSRYFPGDTAPSIPALGPMKISGRLAQKKSVFQLLDITGTIGLGRSSIETRGRVGNLNAVSDIALDTRITGLDIRTLLSALLPTFAYESPLGDMGGTFRLLANQAGWSVSGLALAGGDDTTPLAFSIDGEIKDLAGIPTANLDAQYSLREPALGEALTGLAMNPLAGTMRVETAPGEVRGALKARIGQTLIEGDGRMAVGANRIEGIRLALATPHLYLPDFGLGAARESAAQENAAQADTGALQTDSSPQTTAQQDQAAESAAPDIEPGGSGKPVGFLAQLREQAPPFPVDISLKIDGISGEYSNIDSLLIEVTGIDNRYTLEQFSARYSDALAEIRGIIDLNPVPPALSLAVQAYALPLGAILRDAGVEANVSGALTMQGGITVMGDTLETMLSNLNGSIALALEDAVIEGAAYDLLATDLLAWIYSGALTEKSTHLDCTMAKFQLRQGVATTDSLYIESSRMIATGKAEFDLPRQRMDLRITPLSKSRLLQVPSEVRLRGKMSDPKADISPISAVADATSAALMLIPSLTLKLFGVNTSTSQDTRPCQAELGA